VNYEEEFYEDTAADLDQFVDVTTDALHKAIARHGLCGWIYTAQDAPEWSGDDRIDREMTADICATCPVAAECLEYELRTAGYATDGVWGLLDVEDRRRVFLSWSDRRDGASDDS
jgi:WhiB family transcriptional regulator, redox-sensing transcriptional regulator